MQEYEMIINEIKCNLTGNAEEDKIYLNSMMEKYKTHEFRFEIIKEIGRLMWNVLSDDEKEEFIRASQKDSAIPQFLDEINEYINNNNQELALKRFDEEIDNLTIRFKDDSVSEYHSFRNPLETLLFEKYFKPEKEVRLLPEEYDYAVLYYLYGCLLFESKRHEEAENALKLALKYNPFMTPALFTLGDVLKFKHYPEELKYSGRLATFSTEDAKEIYSEFYSTLKPYLKLVYSKEDLALLYRELGVYYFEIFDHETAGALYILSLNYHYDPALEAKLDMINNLSEIEFENISKEELVKILEDKDIQIGFNKEIYKMLEYLIADFENKGMKNVANAFRDMYDNLD